MGPLRAEPGRSVYISLAGSGATGRRDRGGLPQVLGLLLAPEGQVHQGDQDQPEEEQGSRLSVALGCLCPIGVLIPLSMVSAGSMVGMKDCITHFILGLTPP